MKFGPTVLLVAVLCPTQLGSRTETFLLVMYSATMVTYNCKSIKNAVTGVQQLCSFADLICLQETWLLQHDLPYLAGIHDDFGSTGTSAVDTSAGILKGRPYGGVALLWRKSVFQCVSVIQCANPRIAAIQITTRGRPVLVLSVYMPTDCSENVPELTDCLSTINAIIDEAAIESVFILGDFNAHPGERFYKEILNFSNDQDWICADINMLDTDNYTFVSEAHGCSRWLDHCFVTRAAWQCVVDTYVKYDVYWSDHYPLVICCNLDIVKQKFPLQNLERSKVLWGNRTLEQINAYTNKCNIDLKNIDFPSELQKCSQCKFNCDNGQHKNIIDTLYKNIVNVLCQAASETCVLKKNGRKKRLAGWNKHVSNCHSNARQKFDIWVQYGKPTNGIIYEEMVKTKKIFKGKVKWLQNHQEQVKMDLLAVHHMNADFKNFWKCTNQLNARPGIPVAVDGVSNPKEIANLFVNHFAVKSPLGPPCRELDAEPNVFKISTLILAKDVRLIIQKINRGKSPGHDGLSIEHLTYAGYHLPRVLALLFNVCFTHSYLPPDLMRTVVIPVVKSKTGDVSDKCNYRPISLATTIAKVLDSVLNQYLTRQVKLHDAQFGFRSELSTETAILSLKHTVKYYTDRHTPVYACFLDLSRAFDSVPYDKLWNKLRIAGLPPEAISLFKYWYRNQENRVRWASELSDMYRLECGVRQGGLSSPMLFSLYVNELIEELSSAPVGCSVDGVCINNISYADDMVLLAPSISALRQLLATCEAYATSHGLQYNVKKTEFMIFKAGSKCPTYVPPVHLNGVELNRVYSFKYLGHLVTEHLQDDADMERERRALSVRANMLARRFARCTDAVKVTLFKAYCTSLYSASLWFQYTQRAYNALRVQYNNAFRVLLRQPRFCSASGMFATARTDGFDATWRKKSASLLTRVRGSRNSILRIISYKRDSPMMRKLVDRTKSLLVIKY